MNKAQFVSAVAAKSGITKKDAALAVDSMMEVITEAMKADDTVQLSGFGTFAVKERSARIGRNPKTGEKVTVAGYKYPVFSSSKILKQLIKGK